MATKEKKAPSPKLLTVKIADDLQTVEYTVKGHQPLTLTVSNLSEDARSNAIVLGMGNKIRDMIANLKADTHTDADRYAVIQTAVSHFNGGGDWAKSERAQGDGLVIQAMARVYPAKGLKGAEETIVAYMAKKGITRKAALETWAATRQVAEAIKAIKDERAAALAAKAGLDADALFNELTADDDENDDDQS